MDTIDSWNECPPGVLTEMAGQLRGRRQRQMVGRVGAAVGVIALLLIGYGVSTGRLPGGRIEAISCQEAIELFAQYHASQLLPAVQRRVEKHLNDCPHCQDRYRQLHPSEAHYSKVPMLALAGP